MCLSSFKTHIFTYRTWLWHWNWVSGSNRPGFVLHHSVQRRQSHLSHKKTTHCLHKYYNRTFCWLTAAKLSYSCIRCSCCEMHSLCWGNTCVAKHILYSGRICLIPIKKMKYFGLTKQNTSNSYSSPLLRHPKHPVTSKLWWWVLLYNSVCVLFAIFCCDCMKCQAR